MKLEDLKIGNEYVSKMGAIRKIIAIGDERVFYKCGDENCEQYISEDSMPIIQFLVLHPHTPPKKTKKIEVADYYQPSHDVRTYPIEGMGANHGHGTMWKKVIGSERTIEVESE